MEAASTVAIKVKYEDMMSRFNTRIVENELDLSMDGLREKIISLFNFAPDDELILSYVDEDGDVVNLDDADDLRDAAKQHLNPLRITVQLTCTPSRSLQRQLQNLQAGVAEILKAVPEPIPELIDYFLRVGLSYMVQLSDSQTRAQPTTSIDAENSLLPTETKDLEANTAKLKVLSTDVQEPTLKGSDGLMKAHPEADLENKVQDGSQNGCLDTKERVNKMDTHPIVSFRFEKPEPFSCNYPFFVKNYLPTKEVSRPSEPNVEPKTTCFSSPGPTKLSGLGPKYRCPVSGVSGSVVPSPMIPSYEECSYMSNRGPNDGNMTVFPCDTRRGIRCDGCGVHPITGPRFKSKVKVDYYLCSTCFLKMGNDTDYIRTEWPTVYHVPLPVASKGFCYSRQGRTQPQQCNRYSNSKSCPANPDSRFIEDVNVYDGTVMAPLTPFTKIWRLRNNGMVEWPQKTQLVCTGGALLRNDLSVELEIPASGVPVDGELEVAVDFVAPKQPGQYISYWRMASPSGWQFGQSVWVLIQVDASLNMTQGVNIGDLNLNLPLISGNLPGNPGAINVDPEPVVEDSQQKTENKTIVELVKPVVEVYPLCEETKFSTNEGFLVGSGASSSQIVPLWCQTELQPPLKPVTHPKESLPDVPVKNADGCAASADPSTPPISCSQESVVMLPGKEEIEEKLLSELTELGFKEMQLNKEILRINEYDFKQTVDELCDATDWDPILDDLQEMGFHETETNKRLLMKNKGSFMHTVWDLSEGVKIYK